MAKQGAIVTLRWSNTVVPYFDIEDSIHRYLDRSGFYALLAGVYRPRTNTYTNIRLLYIGQAFGQTFRDRVPQEHAAWNCADAFFKKNPSYKPIVMFGVIASTTAKSITQALFNDIECCLILTNQPLCNTLCKDEYSGRLLVIVNKEDYFPLKKRSLCTQS